MRPVGHRHPILYETASIKRPAAPFRYVSAALAGNGGEASEVGDGQSSQRLWLLLMVESAADELLSPVSRKPILKTGELNSCSDSL